MEILVFLRGPFLASLILTGIHAYLGVHVVDAGSFSLIWRWRKLQR